MTELYKVWVAPGGSLLHGGKLDDPVLTFSGINQDQIAALRKKYPRGEFTLQCTSGRVEKREPARGDDYRASPKTDRASQPTPKPAPQPAPKGDYTGLVNTMMEKTP